MRAAECLGLTVLDPNTGAQALVESLDYTEFPINGKIMLVYKQESIPGTLACYAKPDDDMTTVDPFLGYDPWKELDV